MTLAAEGTPQQALADRAGAPRPSEIHPSSSLSWSSLDHAVPTNAPGINSRPHSSSKHPLDEVTGNDKSPHGSISTVPKGATNSLPLPLPFHPPQEVPSLKLTSNPPTAERAGGESDNGTSTLLPALANWSNSANVRAWVNLPHDDKMDAFNDLVMQCISDDNFLDFSEDVYNNWRRVALGS